MKNVVLTVFVCNFCIILTYDLWMLAILKITFFICNLCSYSTVKHDAFQWLQFLQLFTAIQCSGTLHAVGHCNKNQIAVVRLYFHCKITAKVCSVEGLVAYVPFYITKWKKGGTFYSLILKGQIKGKKMQVNSCLFWHHENTITK